MLSPGSVRQMLLTSPGAKFLALFRGRSCAKSTDHAIPGPQKRGTGGTLKGGAVRSERSRDLQPLGDSVRRGRGHPRDSRSGDWRSINVGAQRKGEPRIQNFRPSDRSKKPLVLCPSRRRPFCCRSRGCGDRGASGRRGRGPCARGRGRGRRDPQPGRDARCGRHPAR